MAIDAYLQIEGIKGESTDDKHRDWIEVSHVAWSVHQPMAESVSTAGGLTNGRAELSNLSFRKLADLSSPSLQQHCAMGKNLPEQSLNSCERMVTASQFATTQLSLRT
jgi:type VI secretion system secreted protein Hcp